MQLEEAYQKYLTAKAGPEASETSIVQIDEKIEVRFHIAPPLGIDHNTPALEYIFKFEVVELRLHRQNKLCSTFLGWFY